MTYLIILAVLILAFIQANRQRRRNVRQYLEPPLQECGVEFISAAVPRLFHLGPFPKLELEGGRPFSRFLGMTGEYQLYRIVTFRDANGKAHQLWACVQFELFRFRRVRWRAETKEGLSPSILNLLEN